MSLTEAEMQSFDVWGSKMLYGLHPENVTNPHKVGEKLKCQWLLVYPVAPKEQSINLTPQPPSSNCKLWGFALF